MYLKRHPRRSLFLVKLQAYSLWLDWEISSFGGAFKDFTKSFRKSFFYNCFFFIFYLFIYLFFQWVLPFVFLESLHCSSKYCEAVYCNIVFIDEEKNSNKKKISLKHQPILRKKTLLFKKPYTMFIKKLIAICFFKVDNASKAVARSSL